MLSRDWLPEDFYPVVTQSYYDWVDEACGGKLFDLHRYVPPNFECYVHICHPIWEPPERMPLDTFNELCPLEQNKIMVGQRWSTLLGQLDIAIDGSEGWFQLGYLLDNSHLSPDGLLRPSEGAPTISILNEIENVISSATDERQTCVCSFWDGFSLTDEQKLHTRAYTHNMSQQRHWLAQSECKSIFDRWRSLLDPPAFADPIGLPNAVWPVDKKWFYAAPFFWHSSFFGGTKDMAQRLLESKEIEAYSLPHNHVFQ